MRGLYVHLPFCNNKCPYCHFYSETAFDESVIKNYFEACLKELDSVAVKSFDTIYFGGGTPSVVHPALLADFIDRILKKIIFSNKEFTMEANPESVSDDFIKFVNSSPVTRISLGVQSFDDGVLNLLGRIHSAKKGRDAVEKIKKTKADLNLDMIFDIPGVRNETILKTAEAIAGFEPQHVSAYSYSADDRNYLTGFDTDNTLFFDIENFFNSKNILKYETSNFASPGKQSEHNKIYWAGDEYIGIGASAHSMIYSENFERIRYSRKNNIYEYISNPESYDIYEKLDLETTIKESVIIGLRMTDGINLDKIEKSFGKINKNLINIINSFIDRGMLQCNGKNLQTTSRGASVLDALSLSLW